MALESKKSLGPTVVESATLKRFDPLSFISERLDAAQKRAAQNKVNYLIYGDYGTGKTHLLSTARQPIWIESFDPGGTELPVIRDMITDGTAVVMDDCEDEDLFKPHAFKTWEARFHLMLKNNVFDHIGTYCIDSLTNFADALMNEHLRKEGRLMSDKQTIAVPQIKDYYVLQAGLKNVMRTCCGLPCDFVLTGHVALNRDEMSGQMISSLLVSGQSATKLPLMFSEVLLTEAEGDKEKIAYTLLTRPSGRNKARTRMGSKYFSPLESPNLMELRRKANRSVEHKPAFTVRKEEEATEA